MAALVRRPFHLMTKPTGPVCNLSCDYCYYLSKAALYPDHEHWRMTEAVLESTIRQFVAAQPGPHVTFAWQGGEPTLMGLDFFRRAVALQQRYVPRGWTYDNALQTNGTLLDAEWCTFLREHDFLVGISVDGPADLHDHHRKDKGGGATQARVMRGLELLQRHNVAFNVLCTVNAYNAPHPLRVYHFFKDSGIDFVQFIPIVERAAGGVTKRSVPAAAYGDFLIGIFDEWVRRDVGRIYVQLFEECFAVWLGRPASLCVLQETCGAALALEHNGDVYACDHFVDPEHFRGNLLERPLAEIVAAPEQRAFGEAKRTTLPAQCRRCDVRFICNGGCPKDRFLLSVDGEPGLNYLCAGFRKFYRHVDPYLRWMAAQYRRQAPPAAIGAYLQQHEQRIWSQAERNQACPCGSGRKFKHCCLGVPVCDRRVAESVLWRETR